jgi:hypothetical protein
VAGERTCGCELWVHKRLQLAQGDVLPLLLEPRALLARVNCRGSHIYVLVAHGPASSHAEEAVVAWWAHVDAEVSRLLPVDSPLVVLADVNGRLGSVESPFVGNHAAAAQDMAGGLFHDFVAQQDLVVPSTFEAFAPPGDGWTWQSSAALVAGRHRIDFVAVPSDWLPLLREARVLEEVNLALDLFVDHRPVLVDVMRPRDGAAGRPRPWFSRALLRLAAPQEAIRCAWLAVPPLSDDWSVEEKHAAFVKVSHLILANACPVGRAAPKAEWVSDATWELIRWKADCAKGCFATAKEVRQLLLLDR